MYNGNVSSIHKNIKKIEVRKTNSIDGFFAKRWSANTPAQLTAFKQCPCWLRFCKKSYGILSFRTSIFFYVFMNTWRHSRIKLRIFKRKGVYVRRYWFSIFVVVDRYLLYSKTLQQIGVYKFHWPSVNESKTYQPIPFNMQHYYNQNLSWNNTDKL